MRGLALRGFICLAMLPLLFGAMGQANAQSITVDFEILENNIKGVGAIDGRK